MPSPPNYVCKSLTMPVRIHFNESNLVMKKPADNLHQLNRQEWQHRLENPGGRYRLKHRYRIALARLKHHQPGQWLDVGAGNGYLAQVARPHLPQCRITGVDFVEEALSQATALDASHVVDLDREALPVASGSQDYVTCLEVLEHVVLPDRLLAEIVRVLKPGGHALISVPNLQFVEYLFALVRGKMPHPAADKRHMSVFTLKHLKKLMRQHGLQPVFHAGCDVEPELLPRLSTAYLSKTILVEGVKR